MNVIETSNVSDYFIQTFNCTILNDFSGLDWNKSLECNQESNKNGQVSFVVESTYHTFNYRLAPVIYSFYRFFFSSPEPNARR